MKLEKFFYQGTLKEMLLLILFILLFVVVLVNIKSYRDSIMHMVGGGQMFPLDEIHPDDLKHLKMAYSARQLSRHYHGPIIKVQRASDDREADFYPTDSAELVNEQGQMLADWALGTTALVTTLYDQSNQGNHAIAGNENFNILCEYDVKSRQYWLRSNAGSLKPDQPPLKDMTGVTYVTHLEMGARRKRMGHPLSFFHGGLNPHIQWSNGSVYEWLGFSSRQRFAVPFETNIKHCYSVHGSAGGQTSVRLDGNTLLERNYSDAIRDVIPNVFRNRSTDDYRLDSQFLFDSAVSQESLRLLEQGHNQSNGQEQDIVYRDDFTRDNSARYNQYTLHSRGGTNKWVFKPSQGQGRLESDTSNSDLCLLVKPNYLASIGVTAIKNVKVKAQYLGTRDDDFSGLAIYDQLNDRLWFAGLTNDYLSTGIYYVDGLNSNNYQLASSGRNFSVKNAHQLKFIYRDGRLELWVNNTISARHEVQIVPATFGLVSLAQSPASKWASLEARIET